MQSIKESLLTLGKLYEKLSRNPIQKTVKGLCISTQSILEELVKNRSHADKLAMFASYYLPETVSIIRQYVNLKSNPKSTERQQLIKEIEDFLPSAEIAFTGILSSLITPSIQQSAIDLDVLIEELKGRTE